MKHQVTKGFLINWFISSVNEKSTPIWTEEHIEELLVDFIILYKEEYIACLNYDKNLNPTVKKCFDKLVDEHFELKEKYSKILEDCHDYRHETHAIKMTIINLMEHFNVSTIEELKNIYINKPYEFEELKRGMHCYVFVNTEVPLSNMKVDALITKICDDKRVEFIFVVENGMVVYKRIPFKQNRFYPREVK